MNITKYLKTHIKKCIYIPNPGNAGDSLIALGTIEILKACDVEYSIGHYTKQYRNETLIYGGGGNLVNLYKNCEIFLNNNSLNNNITILPHTIKDVDQLLRKPEIKNNVTFFCREYISYDYVKNFTSNVYIDHDSAFFIPDSFFSKFIDKEPSLDIAYCFRADLEKTNVAIPRTNKDISIALNINNWTKDPNTIISVCNNMFEYISNYKEIHTNRLHVSIAASLLGKKCYLYSNSYFKNKAIYEFSIKEKFPNTYFIDNEQ
jgi:exopolysaccharide biosynthesis predicted pyruvyltransferase EpsI